MRLALAMRVVLLSGRETLPALRGQALELHKPHDAKLSFTKQSGAEGSGGGGGRGGGGAAAAAIYMHLRPNPRLVSERRRSRAKTRGAETTFTCVVQKRERNALCTVFVFARRSSDA